MIREKICIEADFNGSILYKNIQNQIIYLSKNYLFFLEIINNQICIGINGSDNIFRRDMNKKVNIKRDMDKIDRNLEIIDKIMNILIK